MPIATSNNSHTEKLDLTSCEGAFIECRRLTYGEKIQRRTMTSNMTLEGDAKDRKSQTVTMQLANEQATVFDFVHCILEHNLEEELKDGTVRKLDLTNIQDIRKLDPRVGEEIEEFLDKLNNFEGDEGN